MSVSTRLLHVAAAAIMLVWGSAAAGQVRGGAVEVSEEEYAQYLTESEAFYAVRQEIENAFEALSDDDATIRHQALDVLAGHAESISPLGELDRFVDGLANAGRFEEARAWYARGLLRVYIFVDVVPTYAAMAISTNYQMRSSRNEEFAAFLEADPEALNRAVVDAMSWEEQTPHAYFEPELVDVSGVDFDEEVARARRELREEIEAAFSHTDDESD